MSAIIGLSLAISLAINLVLFLIAFRYKSDKLTDISYSISFISLAILAYIYSQDKNSYSLILFLMIILWGVRIGGFLLRRILKVGKDKRFDPLRDNFINFGKFWLGQAITAWVLLLPVTISIYRGHKINSVAYIGFGIWAFGLIIETIADLQKIQFKNNPENRGKWIQSGIWGYSRHPNYYGEILVWIGVYVYALPGLTAWQRIICLLSPLLISLVLLFVSGVPILEKNADERWGNDPNYLEYKKRTSLILLLPKK